MYFCSLEVEDFYHFSMSWKNFSHQRTVMFGYDSPINLEILKMSESLLRIWSNLLKKSLMENFIFLCYLNLQFGFLKVVKEFMNQFFFVVGSFKILSRKWKSKKAFYFLSPFVLEFFCVAFLLWKAVRRFSFLRVLFSFLFYFYKFIVICRYVFYDE